MEVYNRSHKKDNLGTLVTDQAFRDRPSKFLTVRETVTKNPINKHISSEEVNPFKDKTQKVEWSGRDVVQFADNPLRNRVPVKDRPTVAKPYLYNEPVRAELRNSMPVNYERMQALAGERKGR